MSSTAEQKTDGGEKLMKETGSMNLRELRKNAELSQQDTAAALGVTQSAVSQWESGRCGLRVDLLPKLASLYRCSAQELLYAAQRRV